MATAVKKNRALGVWETREISDLLQHLNGMVRNGVDLQGSLTFSVSSVEPNVEVTVDYDEDEGFMVVL